MNYKAVIIYKEFKNIFFVTHLDYTLQSFCDFLIKNFTERGYNNVEVSSKKIGTYVSFYEFSDYEYTVKYQYEGKNFCYEYEVIIVEYV